jgi:hypothetical protein
MKINHIRIGALTVILFFFQLSMKAQECVTSGPIISEWAVGIGGSLNASFIEIYNGTGAALNMANYNIVTAVNGEWLTVKDNYNYGVAHLNNFALTGELYDEDAVSVVMAPGDIFIFCNDSAFKYLDTLVPDLGENVYVRKSNWTANINTFNGNPPNKAFLYIAENKSNLPPVDVIGKPGGSWGGLKIDLRRIPIVLDPATTYDVGKWESNSGADVAVLSDIGEHMIHCTSEIVLKNEEGIILVSEDEIDAGTILIPNSIDTIFTITNLGGNRALELDTPAAQVSDGITLTSDAGLKTLQTDESTTITISISPLVAGPFSGTVTIPTNDINNNPFIINIVAEAIDHFIDPPTISLKELYVRNGNTLDVEFTSYGTFTGDFEIQLSDEAGSFNSPTIIGTLAVGEAGVKNYEAQISTGTSAGTGYRIRIYNSDNDFTSADNGEDINIIEGFPAGLSMEEESGRLVIYPNPANETLHISCETNERGTLRIIGLGGKLYSETQFERDVRTNVSDLPEGIYIIQVETRTENLYKKIIIQ